MSPLFALVVLALSPCCARNNKEVRPVKCERLQEGKFDAVRASLEAIPRFVPVEARRAHVRFDFSLDPEAVGHSLFVIYSHQARAALYRGPYRPTVNVEIDDRFAADDYYDEVDFRLLLLDERGYRGWTNEQGQPYFRPGARIAVTLLEETTRDEDDLHKDFDVSIR